MIQEALGRRPGVLAVEANPVAQTATITYDPAETSVEQLREVVERCGFHCAGRSVPCELCDPLASEEPLAPARDHAAEMRADEAHGHGGHAGMSMDAMVRDMRNRFLVALVFAAPIALWSPLGESLFGSTPPTPFDMGDDLWQFFLSLPVIFYSSWIFFRGAFLALRAKTLDMMVLVAVAIGTGWIYSVAETFWIEGDVFYDAAAFLAAFVLLGHWFEMRARGGANDAIRALLDLAPPKSVVIRDGVELEIPTAKVRVDHTLLIRPGAKVPVDAEVLEGESSVDESMVTGESLPVSKKPGETLIGATIYKQGTLRARATAVGSDTALAQIVKLVQEAQNSKAPAQRLADRAAFWLVLVALIGGVGTFLVWWGIVDREVLDALLSWRSPTTASERTSCCGWSPPWSERASTRSPRRSSGRPRSAGSTLRERSVSRPSPATARSPPSRVAASSSGTGGCSTASRSRSTGSRRARSRWPARAGRSCTSPIDGLAAGLIEAPRDSSYEAIAALKEARHPPGHADRGQPPDGGADRGRARDRRGARRGPSRDKAAKVAELQAEGRTVAMVGDGVNDAPALAQADVGVAIGAGTDVAIETADVVLMRSNPIDVATAVAIGRGTVRKMKQNLGWAIGYNSLALPIAAGIFEPWGLTLRPEIAAISMSGSSVLVAVNAVALKGLNLPRRDGTAVPSS